jgi:hypothetical protein
MKQHEREFFISTIRSGKTFLKDSLIVHSPTIDQLVESCQKYNEAYEQALNDGLMTEDDMSSWMKEHYLWTSFHENKLEEIKKKVENLKVDIYDARQDPKLAKRIRSSIREAEDILSEQLLQKNYNYQNTCEGFASTEKTSWLIQNLTFKHNQPYDFSDIPLQTIVEQWYMSFLPDSKCRELARNEPWKSLWIIREKSQLQLFANTGLTELNYNQKNLIVWSQMYDNIQESLDCPSKDVIEDDDMLDGWFIVQNRKREKEKIEKEFENSTKNTKIKGASEVFIMAKDPEKAKNIQNMNSQQAKAIIDQRSKIIESKGTVGQEEFADEKMKIHTQKMEMASQQAKSK